MSQRMSGERVTDMRHKNSFFNPYGLRARLGLSLLTSAVICAFFFLVINTSLNYLYSKYYVHSDFERYHVQRQSESLQKFIDKNQISTENLPLLKAWEKRQPVVLLELYSADTCLYSSIYDVPVCSLVLNDSLNTLDCMSLQLADKQVEVFIYSDFTYQFMIVKFIISTIVAWIVFIWLVLHNSSTLIRYIIRLNEEVQILEGGNLEYCVSEEGNDEITDLACSMNRMRITLQQQMETEQWLHIEKGQLITEMSHDLRTPLTGIMLYLEILRSRRYESEEQMQVYLEKIYEKAHVLKQLSDHLFEYSIQNSHHKQTVSETMDHALRSSLTNLADDLTAHGFTLETNLEWKSCFMQINSEYVQRIIDNIVSNIEKYAERSAVVRIETLYTEKYCGFSVMNSISTDLPHVESNGIGIESIRNMVKQMNGVCNIEQTDTTFEITLLFNRRRSR